MKNKILIIGILIGAIIATSAFLIYNKTLQKDLNNPEMIKMNKSEQREPPSSSNMGELQGRPNQNGGTPPEIPSNSNNSNI